MAADIKNYLKEKEKRQKNQDDYKKKIRKHKLTIVYRVLLVAAALGAALALVVVQAKRHIYTGYDTVSSVNRETSSDAIDVRLKNGILTYSKDGAHCTDAKGNVKWNQTYVIQAVCAVSDLPWGSGCAAAGGRQASGGLHWWGRGGTEAASDGSGIRFFIVCCDPGADLPGNQCSISGILMKQF